jgi:hypothetical protein
MDGNGQFHTLAAFHPGREPPLSTEHVSGKETNETKRKIRPPPDTNLGRSVGLLLSYAVQ